MDKEKQIEEMANIINHTSLVDAEGNSIFVRQTMYETDVIEIANELFHKGYRKIDKDSVVLDHYDAQKYYAYKIIEPQIKGCLDRERALEEQLKVARKQAVKEFAERLKESLNDMEYRAKTERKTLRIEEVYEQMNWILHKVVQSKIDEIAKEMGVEL